MDYDRLMERDNRFSRRVVIVFASLLIFGQAFSATGIHAEQAPPAPSAAVPATRAVLVRGSIPIAGIPHLAPNALPALEGEYRFRGEAVFAYFTREVLYFPPEWSPRTYGAAPVLEMKAGNRAVAAFKDPSGFYLLLDFPDGAAWRASFFSAFKSRFDFFMQSAKTDSDISFPAVFDVSGP